MGCCEAKREHELNLHVKAYMNNTVPTTAGYQPSSTREERIATTRTDFEAVRSAAVNKKPEIPKTKEVKIPSAEIPLEIIKIKKRLQLTIFESKCLTEGTALNINPGGLDGSERMSKDGVIIFGTKTDDCVNDFNFPDEEEIIGKRHFEIKYDISKDGYKIKNLFGSGLFIKITKKMVKKIIFFIYLFII
jgi:hypothetical protein